MKKKTILTMVGGAAVIAAIAAVTFVSTSPVITNAAFDDFGAGAALLDEDLTVEDMLTYAIQDEYLAQTTYSVVIDSFGEVKVFTKLLAAETRHIAALDTLMVTYAVAPVENLAPTLIVAPESLDLAYEALLGAEAGNIEMYNAFLASEIIPEDVAAVFTRLRDASIKHSSAGTKAIEGTCTGDGIGSGKQSGKDNGSKGGQGSKGSSASQGDCTGDATKTQTKTNTSGKGNSR